MTEMAVSAKVGGDLAGLARRLKDNPDLFDLDDKQFGNVDKNLLKKVVEEIKLGRVEFYFNQVTSDIGFSDNINVGKGVGRVPENNDQLRKLCDMLPEQLSSYFGIPATSLPTTD